MQKAASLSRSRVLATSVSALIAGSLLLAAALAAAGCADDELAAAPAPGDAGLADNRVDPLDATPSDAQEPAPAVTCEEYCALVDDACRGSFAPYASRAECRAFCAAMPAGDRSDRTTNSVSCRAYHAGIPATTTPAVHCPTAGPFGGGVCGDRCTTFCQLAFALCTGTQDGSAPPFASVPDCVTACAGFPYQGGAQGSDGGTNRDAGDGGQDTLDCRLELLRGTLTDASLCGELGSPSAVCR